MLNNYTLVGGTHYTGGHGVIVEGESIKIDTDVVVEQNDIREVTQAVEIAQDGVDKATADIQNLNTGLAEVKLSLNTAQKDFEIAKQNLDATAQDLTATKDNLAGAKQTLSETAQSFASFKDSTTQNVTALTNKDADLQTQIDNLENGTTTIPVATAGKPGIVMPRQGLSIDSSGALNATLQEYLDLGTGRVFLDHGQSKVVKLYYPCDSIYLEFYLIDTVNVAGSYSLFMSTVSTNETITKGNLTATFARNGTSISLTNNHATNAMFVNYGCADLK